ncbi:hypothetical protein OIU79_011167 [Salix purpurea]|uniref:PB1 domain-containing protein n=1 Tax=Salix purpurea TaxID=77065 RepID=A0A9Q0TAM9_SALPP|nr:hypothetical protein OIU79_011167 [Salix purpurea]
MVDEAGFTASSSPRSRVKFLCSYGGKILPRAVDGHLKYVGGETRVIAIPRGITFSELTMKLSAEFEGDMVLKHQVIPEELDILVSVKSDEDLKHMLEEYDRHESAGTPKFRAFLFPSNPAAIEKTTYMDPYAPEQRYLDSINASPESNTFDSLPHEPTCVNNNHLVSSKLLTRVHSSPSLCNLNSHHHQSSNLNNHHLYQHHHHYYPHNQQHHPHGHQPSRPAHEPNRLSPSSSLGRPEFGRAPAGIGLNQYYFSRHNFGSGNSSKYGHYDENPSYGLIRTADRSDSLPQSLGNRIVE